MGFFDALFGKKLYPREQEAEVKKLIDELIKIGIKEDYLSERAGMGYNAQCRHIRTREIGKRLLEIGGTGLMQQAYIRVRKQAGKVPASHLEYAWDEIGNWQP